MEKIDISCTKGPMVGPYWLNAPLLTGQIWADYSFLIILNSTYKINLGLFYAKTCNGLKQFCFSKLGLSFNFQTNTLSNS